MVRQKIVIQVPMPSEKRRIKAFEIAAAACGVMSVALHGPEKDKLLVVGDDVDAVCLTTSLRKKLCHARLETVEEVKDKKVEAQKKDDDKKDKKDTDKQKGASEKEGDKKDKDPKAVTPIVCCYRCRQPQLEFYPVVADPHPGPCTIL